MVQEELAGVGVQPLLGLQVLQDDPAHGRPRSRFVLDVDLLLLDEPLEHGAGDAIRDLVTSRHTPFRLYAADATCQGTAPETAAHWASDGDGPERRGDERSGSAAGDAGAARDVSGLPRTDPSSSAQTDGERRRHVTQTADRQRTRRQAADQVCGRPRVEALSPPPRPAGRLDRNGRRSARRRRRRPRRCARRRESDSR